MLEGFELQSSPRFTSSTQLAWIAAWVIAAIAVAYLLGWVVSLLLRRFVRDRGIVHDLATFTRRPFRATLIAIGANIALAATVRADTAWRPRGEHVLHIVIIAAAPWLVAGVVMVAERGAVARVTFGGDEFTGGNRRQRRIQTQVMTLRRLATVIIVVLGAAAALMT